MIGEENNQEWNESNFKKVMLAAYACYRGTVDANPDNFAVSLFMDLLNALGSMTRDDTPHTTRVVHASVQWSRRVRVIFLLKLTAYCAIEVYSMLIAGWLDLHNNSLRSRERDRVEECDSVQCVGIILTQHSVSLPAIIHILSKFSTRNAYLFLVR